MVGLRGVFDLATVCTVQNCNLSLTSQCGDIGESCQTKTNRAVILLDKTSVRTHSVFIVSCPSSDPQS